MVIELAPQDVEVDPTMAARNNMNRTTAALIAGLSGWTGCAPAVEAPVPRTAADPSRPGVHKLEELRGPQVDALDRERTLFILPVGMIEVHGPHLPIGNDSAAGRGDCGKVARGRGRVRGKRWLAQR